MRRPTHTCQYCERRVLSEHFHRLLGLCVRCIRRLRERDGKGPKGGKK